MRAKSVTFSLVIVTLLATTVCSFSASAGKPSHIVVCQAYLSALDKVKPELRSNPMVSIQELQDYLLRSRGHTGKFDISTEYPYAYGNYLDSFLKPSKLSLESVGFRGMMARLAQLQKDAISNDPSLSRVAIELRGADAVTQYMKFLEADFTKTHAAVEAELNKKFPRLRAGNLIHGAVQGMIAGLAYFAVTYDPGVLGYFGAGFAAVVSAVVEVSHRLPPRLYQNSGLQKQLEVAGRCSRGECSDYPVTIVSGSLRVPTEIHRAILNSQDISLEDLVSHSHETRSTAADEKVEATKEIFRLMTTPGLAAQYDKRVAELAQRIKDSPDGIARALYYDSIFYMDPVRNEPVWLVYYRAFKDKPTFKPPQKKEAAEAEEESWDSGQMLPGYLPVPTR